jgi:hypothetical protein
MCLGVSYKKKCQRKNIFLHPLLNPDIFVRIRIRNTSGSRRIFMKRRSGTDHRKRIQERLCITVLTVLLL